MPSSPDPFRGVATNHIDIHDPVIVHSFSLAAQLNSAAHVVLHVKHADKGRTRLISSFTKLFVQTLNPRIR